MSGDDMAFGMRQQEYDPDWPLNGEVECPKSGGGEHEEDHDLGICHWCDAPMSENFITREQWGEEHGFSVHTSPSRETDRGR